MQTPRKLAAMMLAAAVTVACADSSTAPSPNGQSGQSGLAAPLSLETRRAVEYSARCEMWYFERTPEVATTSEVERIWGTGVCKVDPFGPARMTLEGLEKYTPAGFVVDGVLVYRFEDGSRLMADVRLTGGEVLTQGRMVFNFGQHFVRGTGRFVRTSGGEGYGEGSLVEATGAMNYRSRGRVLFETDK